jgi:hypothetical protein
MKTTQKEVRTLIDLAIARQGELFRELNVNDSTQQALVERIRTMTAKATLECVRDAFDGTTIFLKILGEKP